MIQVRGYGIPLRTARASASFRSSNPNTAKFKGGTHTRTRIYIRHVAKCLYMRARALIIIVIYNARVSAGAVKWQDKDRFDSCCTRTRNQPRHSIIVFIASQIPYNEIHFFTTSICTVIAA